jgi:hypothetical protein
MHVSSGDGGRFSHVGPGGEIEGCYVGSGAEVLEQGVEEGRVFTCKSSVYGRRGWMWIANLR